MKTLLYTFALFFIGNQLFSQNIVFTDVNFKNALLGHSPTIDTSGDNEISIQEAAYLSSGLSLSYYSISNVSGLEHFVNVTQLYVDGNNISNLDVTALTSLTALACNDNNLSALDVSQNTGLLTLNVFNNSLVSLDLTLNVNLTNVSCFNNSLMFIEVQNGNNLNMGLSATGNPSACIEVDDIAYSIGAFNWSKDASATYSLICSTTGIESADFDFVIFPNPVQDVINVQASGFYKMEISDISGKNIIKTFESTTNLSKLVKGVYLLKVYNTEGNFTIKRIIKK